MKNSEVEIGATYLCRVSGKIVAVNIKAKNYKGWHGVSLATGRDIWIKSARRLREKVVT